MTPTALALPGRLFGPELAPAGVTVRATLDAVQLSLSLNDGRRFAAPLTQLALRRAGFDGAQIELSWSAADARHALLVDDADAIRRLLAGAPEALQPQLTQLGAQRRRAGLRRGLGLSAIAIWLGLPLLALLALLLSARPLAGWVAGLVPLAQEQRLGDAVFQAQRAGGLQLIADGAAQRAVEAIGARLTAGSRYTYRWHVAREPSLNAFAIPGGIVVVHSGLIAAAGSAHELAGVLAHEVEHVERRHSLKALLQQAGLRLAIGAVLGDFGIAGDAAGRLSGLQFSRDNEREADALGLQRLYRCGIDPRGMLRLFAKLDAEAGGRAPPAWLASHPPTPDRLQQLTRQIGERGPPALRPLDIDWAAVQASLGE